MTRFLRFNKRQRRAKLQFSAHNIIRHLSKLGVCSRKQACNLVLQGRIQVNGKTIKDPGKRVSGKEKITLDGKSLPKKEKVYLLLHKPPGYVTTRKDEKGKKTIYDLLPNTLGWIFPVGRLDQDSEGLLLLTNDTSLGERLSHPRYQVPRTYTVTVKGHPSVEDLKRIGEGLEIGQGEKTRPAHVKVLRQHITFTLLEITLTEGKNREIRRIFDLLGKPVTKLIRTQFGPFHLGSLKSGEYRRIPVKCGVGEFPPDSLILPLGLVP